MNELKITIIVPVFNTEMFLEDCLLSIQAQSYLDFECLCINDGSTDNSVKIIDGFSKIDSRFKLYNQNNEGLASARNTGIKNATGSWICFVDSDDIISPKMLERLIENVKKYSVDYISFDYSTIAENSNLESIWNTCSNTPVDVSFSDKPLFDVLNNRYPFRVSACMHLFSKVLFNDVRFDVGMKMHEDTFPSILLLKNSNRAVHIFEKLYFYRNRKGSITRSNSFIESASFLKKNIFLAFTFSKEIKLNNKEIKSLFSKCGCSELSNLAVSIVLNKTLPEKERNESIIVINETIKHLRKADLFSLHDSPIFIKFAIFLAYRLNSPNIFRFFYSIIWYKRWKEN